MISRPRPENTTFVLQPTGNADRCDAPGDRAVVHQRRHLLLIVKALLPLTLVFLTHNAGLQRPGNNCITRKLPMRGTLIPVRRKRLLDRGAEENFHRRHPFPKNHTERYKVDDYGEPVSNQK